MSKDNPGAAPIIQAVSEFAYDEIINFTKPQPGALKIPVNRSLPFRKLYTYLWCPGSQSDGWELFITCKVNFLLDGRNVGSLPMSIGNGGKQNPDKLFSSLVCIGTGNKAASNPDSILVCFAARIWNSTQDFEAIINPQYFYGEFDTISVDILDLYNAANGRIFVGCMSGIASPFGGGR